MMCLEPEFESPFVHLDFHTAVIGKNIKYLCEGCFNGCKNLKKIVLHDGIKAIEEPIAQGADCVKEIPPILPPELEKPNSKTNRDK